MKSFRIIRSNRFFAMEVTESGCEAQQLPLYAYMTYQPAKGCYSDFLDAGVRLMSVAVYAGDRGINPFSSIRPFRPGFMAAPGEYDFRWLDEDLCLATAGRKKGEVYVLLRVMLEMPLWWEESHPEARCLDAAGVPLHCSFSSEEWLSACVDVLDAMHRHLEESGWSDYVAGYHIAAGQTEEFIRPVFHPLQCFDYSDVSVSHFREWSKALYQNDLRALNAAWKTAYTDDSEITPPTPHERRYYQNGSFRDPQTEQKTIDYMHFISEELVDFIICLSEAAKALTSGTKLIGAFYGYNSITDPAIGHNATARIFDCPAIDFFASPFFYTETRSPARDWPFQGAIESAALHGKPWFTEADVRTYLSRPISECMPFADAEVTRWYETGVWYGPDTQKISLAQMLRALARITSHGSAVWWFDMWGGWYDDEAMMQFHAFAQKFYADAVFDRNPPSALPPMHAQLAVFIDKTAADGMTPAFSGRMIPTQLEALGALGAPYDVYAMDDFAAVDPAPYRMALLLSPAKLLDPDALSRWKQNGRTLFFVGLPGYFAEKGLIGADTDIAAEHRDALFSGEGIFNGIRFPGSIFPMPYILPQPAKCDTVLAADDDGHPVAVLHCGKDYQTVWSVLPYPPLTMLREQFQLSGGHLYTHSDDVIYACDDTVTMLASAEGIKRIFFPYPCEAYDAVTGVRVPGTELVADFVLEKGEAKMLRLQKISS